MQETISASGNKLGLFRSGLSLTSISFDRLAISNALAVIEDRDFPTTHEESWKYTRLSKLANSKFSGTSFNKEVNYSNVHSDAYRFIFENGRLIHSSEGINAISLKAATEMKLQGITSENSLFDAINLAYAEDGLLIEISAKEKLQKPIEIVHIANGNKVSNLRHIFRVGDFAEAEITLLYTGSNDSTSFINVVSNIELGTGSHLTINKLQSEFGTDFHFSKEFAKQQKDSNLTLNTLTLNGNFVRNDVVIRVEGQNAESNLNGAYILRNNQLVDNHTVVDHLVPNCQSNELYKGVLYDKSTAVFNGKVFVRQDAQKINAFQSNGNVMMSEGATVYSKPELEIYADDVKCSHGSTTGQLDEEAIYYLRARGISEKSAKELLVSAFVGDVLNNIENQEVLDFTNKFLSYSFGWKNN